MSAQSPRFRLPVLLLAALPFAASSPPQHLFWFVDEGGHGFVDIAGRTVIAPRFADADQFREGLAPVLTGSRWGYIDQAGEVVIPYQFDAAAPFFEGRAVIAVGVVRERRDGLLVTMDSGRHGFIDRSGAVVIPAVYDAADRFSEGLAAVVLGDTIRYIDPQGRTVFELPDHGYGRLGGERRFSEGLVAFAEEAVPGTCSIAGQPRRGDPREWCWKRRGRWFNGVRWGFLDRRGEKVIPARFWAVGRFVEGLARVAEPVPEEEGGGVRFGYIDRSGAIVLRVNADPTDEPQLLSAVAWRWPLDDFSEGRAAVRSGGRWGYIDRAGAWVVEPRFTEVGRFSEGRSWVRFPSGDAKTDARQEIVSAWGFASGPHVGFIGPEGEVLVEPRFTRAEDYENGLSRIEVRTGVWGYIDHAGKYVLTPR